MQDEKEYKEEVKNKENKWLLEELCRWSGLQGDGYHYSNSISRKQSILYNEILRRMECN